MARVGDEAALYKPHAAVYRPPTAGRPAATAGVPAQAKAPPPPAAKGSQIPGAGVYLQQQALAQRAFEQAQSDVNYRRGQMYSEFGLLPGGKVDPASRYGAYQQMLGQDATQQQQAQYGARARGLGQEGLGGRVMNSLRNAQGGQHFAFQRTLANNLHGFDQDLLSAANTRSAAMLSAEQQQAQWALEHGAFTPAAPSAAGTTPTAGTAKVATIKAAPSRKNTAALRKSLAAHIVAKRRV